jgi:hypothetical protein
MHSTLPSINLQQPANDETEISLFGPGAGESIVLHCGNGNWFIIDTFISSETKLPIAIEYLESLGLDPSICVKGILLTHWHADHTKGAFELFKRCTSAKLYLPLSFNSHDFFCLMGLFSADQFSSKANALGEYEKILRYVRQNNMKTRLAWIKNGHLFFDLRTDTHTRMIALSPSDTTVVNAAAKFASLNPQDGDDRIVRIIGGSSENLGAVAVHFSFGSFSALLGSDLESRSAPEVGWSAVINADLYAQYSLSKAAVYKVAHHGSATGEHPDIWAKLLKDLPISIVTPFTPQANPLPLESDLNRLANYSSEVYLTRATASAKPVRRDKMVEREMNSIVISRKPIDRTAGHIQIRASEKGSITTMSNAHVRIVK